MKMLSEAFISLCDLVEAEGRLLKHKTLKMVGTILLMILASLLFLMTLILVMIAIYHVLILNLSETIAYLVIASLILLFT